MWIKRDFEDYLAQTGPTEAHPIKVLKGPRQVGKTSLLERTPGFTVVRLEEFATRHRAMENPSLFLSQWKSPYILDEATLVPELFLELKTLVDRQRRLSREGHPSEALNVWITGSNQTLLETAVQESLAGRSSYFDLNTLSVHEIGRLDLADIMLKGGWPYLQVDPDFSPERYLNDLISTFIERDIVAAAGIERKEAFTRATALLAGRVGQLFNASDIAKNVGVESTTLSSWAAKLQQNAIVRLLPPYFTNLNQRLIKSPKVYFEDVGLASRLQGWREFAPLYVSPMFGHLFENLVLIEICRFFTNRGRTPEVYFLRNKEQVEVDFLVRFANNRWLAVEAKAAPAGFTPRQTALLESLQLDIVGRWVVSPTADAGPGPGDCMTVPLLDLFDRLLELD